MNSVLLVKRFTETIENKIKEQRGKFLGMLVGKFVERILRNMLVGKSLTTRSSDLLSRTRWRGSKARITGGGTVRAR